MYSAIKSALILCTLHVQGRNVHRRGAMTCLCVSLGEKVGQHEMTMCDFCLRLIIPLVSFGTPRPNK